MYLRNGIKKNAGGDHSDPSNAQDAAATVYGTQTKGYQENDLDIS